MSNLSDKKPSLSVVIPTCGRPELLRSCLERLHPRIQNIESAGYEVIVTDDRPSDSTRSMIARLDPLIRYISGPGKGPAANRNHGVSQARGHWLVFLDDDCVPEPGLLNAYQDRILHDQATRVLEGSISPMGIRNRIDENAPINEHGGCLWSCNFCIRKDLFIIINGFDESFPMAAMEDVDLRYRLSQSGEKMIFLPNAKVLHPYTLNGGGHYIAKRVQSILYFHQKHALLTELSIRSFVERFLRNIYKTLLIQGWKYGFRGARRFLYLETQYLYESIKQYVLLGQ